MTASEVREWVQDEGNLPTWLSTWDEQELIKRFWKSTVANNSKNTLSNRATAVKQFSEWSLETSLSDVTASDIEQWRDELVTDDYGYRSVRQKLYALSTLFNYAERHGKLQANPVDSVDIDHYEKTKQEEHLDKEYVSKDEFAKMKAACDTTRQSLICQLFWDTGVRIGEAVDIRLDDIDEGNRSVTIETSKTKKMEKDQERIVYYSRKFESTLNDWRYRGDRESYLGASGSDYLLVSEEAHQMHETTVGDILRDVSKRSNVLKEVYEDQSGRQRYWPHPHALRKSYGVYRTKNGMPVAYLSDLMGHSDIQTTKEKYLKFRDDDRREADRKYRPNPY